MATASVTTTFSNATLAKSAEVNDNFDDIVVFANGETIHRDGSKAATANLPMGNNKLTGLGAAAANGDAVRYEQHVPAALVDAKGDLLVATAADTLARLAVGANGLTLIADSVPAVGAKWAAIDMGAVPAIEYLTADQTIAASGALQTVNDISLPVGANTRWFIKGVIHWQTAGAEFFSVSFGLPAGATFRIFGWGTSFANPTWGSGYLGNFGQTLASPFWANVEIGGTAGNLTLTVDNVSGANGGTIFRGTNLMAWQLA